MTKNFDNPLRYPLFSENDPDYMVEQAVRLNNGGALRIKSGDIHRITLTTNGTYWTTTALDQAIAALLHIRQEWREELEARGILPPEGWPDEDLEDDGDEDEEAPVEPAEGPEEAVQRAHDEMVRDAGGARYRAWLEEQRINRPVNPFGFGELRVENDPED